ncbi:hypothetical protein [Kordia jejudonensis]|uniref:hypothetical protein n=1 Tax=Kordia jejudonensis TaxID=1348245 RepID=UPI0006294D8E|nr:hypothetical protein [Kordia jejudonensis]
MRSVNDLIILHFQKGFFNMTNNRLKNIVKATLEPIVKRALQAKTHISFWLDPTFDDAKSVIKIPINSSRVTRADAPAGVYNSYTLHGSEIILAGGWFGACMNNAIRSIMKSFFRNPSLAKTGELTIRMPGRAVYDQRNLLSEISNNNIAHDLVDALQRSKVLKKIEVKERGLQILIIKSQTNETILKKIIVAPPTMPTLEIFDIVFLID